LCVRENVGHRSPRTGFDDLDFEHNALPELALDEVDISTTLGGHTLAAPLIISSMTGGYEGALAINRGLAEAADRYGLAMGVGSERQALENSEHHETFRTVRSSAPHAFLFGNIGGVEVARLAREGRIDMLRRITDLIEANALAIHLNPLQELLQPEGSHDYRGVLTGIEECVRELGIPIIVKEVGAGISRKVAQRLLDVGVRIIDVAGAGGTSWAGVEILRNEESDRSQLEPFWDWGISTVDALMDLAELRKTREFETIASGGIRTGVDIAKALTLGATAAGVARPLIKALVEEGESKLDVTIRAYLFQLRAAMYLTGSRNIEALRTQQLILR
jgi:isopentenyl-diphosphate delta-isomerase